VMPLFWNIKGNWNGVGYTFLILCYTKISSLQNYKIYWQLFGVYLQVLQGQLLLSQRSSSLNVCLCLCHLRWSRLPSKANFGYPSITVFLPLISNLLNRKRRGN
jgi:hypothetical protein